MCGSASPHNRWVRVVVSGYIPPCHMLFDVMSDTCHCVSGVASASWGYERVFRLMTRSSTQQINFRDFVGSSFSNFQNSPKQGVRANPAVTAMCCGVRKALFFARATCQRLHKFAAVSHLSHAHKTRGDAGRQHHTTIAEHRQSLLNMLE